MTLAAYWRQLYIDDVCPTPESLAALDARAPVAEPVSAYPHPEGGGKRTYEADPKPGTKKK